MTVSIMECARNQMTSYTKQLKMEMLLLPRGDYTFSIDHTQRRMRDSLPFALRHWSHHDEA